MLALIMIEIFAMRASDDYDESEHSQRKDTLLKCMTIGVQTKKKLTNKYFHLLSYRFQRRFTVRPWCLCLQLRWIDTGKRLFLKQRDRRPETRMTIIVSEAFRKLLQK